MKKDEIIELLRLQNAELKQLLSDANAQVSELTLQITNLTAHFTKQISELTAQIASMEGAITKKDEAISKQENINKGITKLLANKSEKAKEELTEEERVTLEKARAIKRKERKNNGAKRNTRPDMEVVEHDVYPDDPSFDPLKARLVAKKNKDGEYSSRVSIRYECIPMRFIKHVYKIHTYTQDGRIYEGKAPNAAFLNSSYDSSFLAGIMQLRYMYSMPIERIVNYFNDNGFDLSKATANGLIKRASEILENVYKALSYAVLQNDYISVDETYYKILVPGLVNTKGTCTKQGYFWVLIGMTSGLVYVLYEDGSRSEQVILDEFSNYSGTIQSDAFTAYKKLESNSYPNIIRIACLQHIKRKFIDCGNDPNALAFVDLINQFHRQENKHKVGVNKWTIEDNLKWRQKYAPSILKEIKEKIEETRLKTILLPKEDLTLAINHLEKELPAIANIFERGDTQLTNNLVERYNRYFSLSRRNSLFFGSHKGAERGAILYSIALSCRMNKHNLFNYIKDVINQTTTWQPNTPLEKYRDLLPDKWQDVTKNGTND